MEPTPPHTRSPSATSQPAHDCTRVLVVDDHPLLRRGIISMLEETADIEVVAEAGSGEEALMRCEEKHPHVVLMDLMLPGMSGVEAIQALHAQHPDIQLVVLTNYEGGDLVQRALQAGAISYLLKSAPLEELIQGIRLARHGKPMIAGPAAASLVREVAASTPRLEQDLSARERDVLTLLVQGLTDKQIAEQLVITSATVKFHLRHIRSKLQTSSRTETVAVALQHHLVSQGEVRSGQAP
jgi:two-component system, NarL family, response regulator LiaR